MHLEELSDALLLALGGVGDGVAGLHMTGVHTHVGQLAEERVSSNLEGECRERLGHGGLAVNLNGLIVDSVAGDVGNVQRAGQVGGDGVEEGLHTLVLEGGTTDDGVGLGIDGELADSTLDFVDGEFFTGEVLLHEFFIGLSDGLDELLTVFGSAVSEIGGDLFDAGFLARFNLARPHEGLHGEQVDNAVEGVFSADGELQNQRLGAEAIFNGLNRVVEVRAHLVHLVDEADAGDVVLGSLTPHLFGLRLDAFLTVEDGDSAVQHTEGALHLNGEVHVAGGVDDVELGALPVAGGGRGGNGNTAFLFLLHPVHGGSAIVSLTDLVVDTGVEQDALGSSGLTSIDVSHDADIANLIQVLKHFKCHFELSVRSWIRGGSSFDIGQLRERR